ncbi:MAG: sigma-70 family RNA polymerase sigma factor [Acidobacteriota bacterium]
MADTTVGFHSEFTVAAAESAGAWSEDRVLAAALRAGEEAAYEALILRFEQPVYGVVCRLLEDPADAPDVVQEVFLKVFRNVGSFRGDSSLKTWIYRIAVNEARNQRRWFGRHRGKEVGLEPATTEALGYGDWLPDPGRGPFEETLGHEVQALVEEGLKRISATYRAALVLREMEELSYEEIAEILEISLGTVKSRILRGRESLRQELSAMTAAPVAGFVPRLVSQRESSQR